MLLLLNIQLNHKTMVEQYINNLPPNKILGQQPPSIDSSEELLPRKQRCTLAQIRAGKSPLLYSYRNLINPITYPSPLCPLCNQAIHDTIHLFNCTQLPTDIKPLDLWICPFSASVLLDAWWAAVDTVFP